MGDSQDMQRPKARCASMVRFQGTPSQAARFPRDMFPRPIGRFRGQGLDEPYPRAEKRGGAVESPGDPRIAMAQRAGNLAGRALRSAYVDRD
jgi:hypothetical protein